jgi:hypothetical protein
MSDTNTVPTQEPEIKEVVTLESLGNAINTIGEQMNWLCDNLAGLFGFVNQMGANGGGIMGLRKALKGMPEMGLPGNGEESE